jgi:uncharacterized membrane-anchored protein YjiN (DUF445 family)
MTVIAPPPVRQQELRRRQLRTVKRRATALLVVTGVVLVVVHAVGHGRGWYGYAQAAAEASMVGGLADWFAVTALFRRPLGLPIPHTAIIRERKDQFGETLGAFVQDNFLTADVVVERIRTGHVVERATDWLADPVNAATIARQLADLVTGVTDAIRDEDVHRALAEALEQGVERLPVAPLAARALRAMTAQNRHQELLDAVLAGFQKFLEENQDQLRERFGQDAPWWLPDAVEDRIFERLLDGVRRLMVEVNADPTHEVRQQFDGWIEGFTTRLETSPDLGARGEQIKQELLAQPELRKWTSGLWNDLKAELRTQAADPRSELRSRLAGAVSAAGRRLQDDPELYAKAEKLIESAVTSVAERFHDEVGDLVTATIARWDPEETSDKLELLLGPDLQYIRINGTVVGGLAGLAIYAVLQTFG